MSVPRHQERLVTRLGGNSHINLGVDLLKIAEVSASHSDYAILQFCYRNIDIDTGLRSWWYL